MNAQVDWQRGAPASSAQSSFVTVVAWIFIALSGGSTLISILQNIMLNIVFSSAHGFPDEKALQHMPPVAAFMFEHMRFYFLAFLIVSAAMLLVSIGLLARREWARIAFIGILVLGILWTVGGVVLQQWLIASVFDVASMPPRAPPDFEAGMRSMTIAIRVFSALFAIAFTVLYGWIIRRLCSREIAAEFA